ncbi:glycosyltransferase family 4 protein [Larkinella sp. VNQ87]|uniref:glycosyltransferase family 4 protein n=1 Tax=Larkinella sp. VNQ87 TaxID=3400921 RepID=UPI003C01FD97
MKVVVNHPLGNANVRAAGGGLVNAGLLAGFTTAIASFPGDIIDRISTLGPFAEFRRRRFDSALKPLTRTWPWLEAGRLIAQKVGIVSLTRHETGLLSVDAVFHNLDRRVAAGLKTASQKGVSAVYAYEDGAAFTFREAKDLGLQCLYDLPIGYWRAARRLLEVERERWPEWAATLTGFRDSEKKLARKDEEIRLADHIFVASQFTARTLADFPGTLPPIHVVPYGFPAVNDLRIYSPISGHKPLKLLFVGGLSQRKGIADLFSVVEKLGRYVSLTVVGGKPTGECSALDAALAKHHWIPSLPHNRVLELMREHDVLVFPSLFEGFGLVITEAMSQGTPVITTDRTAGPDLITHGHDGWLIEAGSTNALQAVIEELRDHPEVIAEIGRNAMETARKRPWTMYGQELADVIRKIL